MLSMLTNRDPDRVAQLRLGIRRLGGRLRPDHPGPAQQSEHGRSGERVPHIPPGTEH